MQEYGNPSKLQEAMAPAMSDFNTLPWDDFLAKYEWHTLLGYFVDLRKMSIQEAHGMAIATGLLDLLYMSVVEIVVSAKDKFAPQESLLEDGMNGLPVAMAEALEGRIRLNVRVVEVRQDENEVVVR